MKLERTKNASRNMVFGGVLTIYQMLVPFLMRTAMIYFMGVQYLGLNSLFVSVLHVLNLAELGVGNAMVYSMYKPISENDTDSICALMKLYRTYYRVIGLVIAVVGLAITPFIPALIKDDVPADVNIYVLYLLNLAATVFSYWLFAYKKSVLTAHQRVDVTSKVTIITNTIQYGLQFLVLCLFRNYYFYVIIILATQILNNILSGIMAEIMYPEFKPKGTLPKETVGRINQRIRDLFTSKIGSVILSSSDTIIISSFLGLRMLAIYQNYYFIITSIISFIRVVFNACLAGIGNSLIVETKEKNFNDFKKFTFLISWISGVCSSCLLCLFQPFITLWVGEDLLLSIGVVVCLVVYFYIYEIYHLINLFKDAAGLWHEDRFRPLATAIANLVMNLIMVQFWGIYGIILSTVLSMLFVGAPWLFVNLSNCLFDRKMIKEYIFKLLHYIAVTACACAISYFLCSYINFGEWSTLFVRLLICATLPNLIYLIAFKKQSEFRESVRLIDNMTKKKLKLEKLLFKNNLAW